MESIKTLFSQHEDWLTERVLFYAKRQGYSEYASAPAEAWRTSIAGLTDAFRKTVDMVGEKTLLEFSPDDSYAEGPISEYAVKESRLHRGRGVSLVMFLGLLKYYRQAYLECIEKNDVADKAHTVAFTNRFFDRMEISLCADWVSMDEQGQLAESQESSRLATNEKNRFLTLFESLATPMFVLDDDLRIEFMNLAAAEFLGVASNPGDLAYALHSAESVQGAVKPRYIEGVVPWLAEALEDSRDDDGRLCHCRFDVPASTEVGPRHFNVSVSSMSDISDDFSGYSVVLDDVSFRIGMEQQLANERNRATHYLDVVGSIVVVLDASGGIALINQTGCSILGYAESELLGQNWIDLIIPEEQSDEVREYLFHIYSEEKEMDDEHLNYVTTKDGRHLLISWRNRLLRNEDGLPVGILSSGMDITEQREAEEALAEKELWLRNTFVALGEAVLILSPDRTVIDANPAAEIMFGMTNDEFVDLPGIELHVDEAHYNEFGRMSQEAFLRGETGDFEFTMRRKNGEVFPTEHSISLIDDDNGLPLGIVHVVRDISERKQAEIALTQSEEKFRRIFETIQEGFIVTDLEGVVTMVNPATCKLLGYEETEIVGEDMGYLYTNSEERNRFRSTLLTRGAVSGMQLGAVKKDGSTIIVEANAHLVRDASGTPVAMEGTFHDITQRIEADKVIREREKQYRAFFENNHAIMLLVDPRSGQIIDANPAAGEFYGYSLDDMRVMKIADINAFSEKEIFEEMSLARQEKRAYFLFKHKVSGGKVRDVEVYSGPIMVRGTQLLYSVIHDVTERVKLERKMKKLATTDALTGADNRHQFFTKATTELKRSKRYRHPMAALMIDIDYFKSINDTHGHQTGDVVLRSLAALAIATLRETDIFGRLGGEEFGAILPETGLKEAMQVAERLREKFAKLMVRTANIEVKFTASIGVTLAKRDDKLVEDVLNRADEALYKAKRMGRNRVERG